MAWLKRRHYMENKPLQYTYCAISQEVKAIRQWNFGQLIEYNMVVFLEKSYTKCGGETISRPFPKKWAYVYNNSLKFYIVCFYCMSSCRLSKYIETKLQTTCFLL